MSYYKPYSRPFLFNPHNYQLQTQRTKIKSSEIELNPNMCKKYLQYMITNQNEDLDEYVNEEIRKLNYTYLIALNMRIIFKNPLVDESGKDNNDYLIWLYPEDLIYDESTKWHTFDSSHTSITLSSDSEGEKNNIFLLTFSSSINKVFPNNDSLLLSMFIIIINPKTTSVEIPQEAFDPYIERNQPFSVCQSKYQWPFPIDSNPSTWNSPMNFHPQLQFARGTAHGNDIFWARNYNTNLEITKNCIIATTDFIVYEPLSISADEIHPNLLKCIADLDIINQ